MTKRILILLFAVLLTGMSEDGHGEDNTCDGGDDADAGYTARGGDYGHGKKPPRFGVYVDDDTDNCANSLDALDPVDQESAGE